jgi:hypothetical protein
MSNVEFSNSIVDGTVYSEWWFYIVWLLVTAVGAALGVWIRERIKGDVSKEIWLAQESWKEKYRLYTAVIEASEEITAALWEISTDFRTLKEMDNSKSSSQADGLRIFPEHQKYLDRESRAHDKLMAVEVGIELMLNSKAKEAFESIKTANTRSMGSVDMTYRQRIEERCNAAAAAKESFILAAKDDLKI